MWPRLKREMMETKPALRRKRMAVREEWASAVGGVSLEVRRGRMSAKGRVWYYLRQSHCVLLCSVGRLVELWLGFAEGIV